MPHLLLPLIALFSCIAAYAVGARELHEGWPAPARFRQPRALLAYVATLGVAIMVFLYAPQPVWLLAIFAGLLVAIAWLDLETGMLSDLLTLALAALALGYDATRFATFADWLPTLGLSFGLLALGWFFAGPYSRWRGRDMLGWGDVKFFAAAGLWLTPLQLPAFLILAGGAGALAAVAYKMKTGKAETPFAPALCLSLLLCVVFGLSLDQLLS